MKTFLYSNKQEDLVGLDGEQKFSKVFSEECRIVVVLYRKKYGTTAWTRIEETAIKNRALKEGYDFTIYIPVEKEKNIPPYLPKTRIWFDLERFGPEGARIIIEKRVTDFEGEITYETSEDKAKRLKRKLEHETRLEQYLNSYDSKHVREAYNEYNFFKELLKEKLNIAIAIFSDKYDENDKDETYVFRFLDFQIELYWQKKIDQKTPEIKILLVQILENHGLNGNPNYKIHDTLIYKYSKNILWENIWKIKVSNDERVLKSEILAEEIVSKYIDVIDSIKVSQR